MSNYPKLFITEDVYFACMSLTYTTNKIDYIAFIFGEKISEGKDSYNIGLLLYLSDIINDHLMNKKICNIIYEHASDTAGLIGALCNQPLKVVGWFHPHLHTFSADPTSHDIKIFNTLAEKEPTIFCLIASISVDSKLIHSSTMQVYRNKKGNVQPVSFTIVPSGRKVFFDKAFSLSQIFHMLKRREINACKEGEKKSDLPELFLQKLKSQKGLERYSYHIHRFVYPAFQIMIQDKKIIRSLEQFYSGAESMLAKHEKKK